MESNPRRRRCREIVRATSLARDRSSAPGSTFGRSAVWLNRVVATSLQFPSTTTATTTMGTMMTMMITGSACRHATSHDFAERAPARAYTHLRAVRTRFTRTRRWSIGRNGREISAGRRIRGKQRARGCRCTTNWRERDCSSGTHLFLRGFRCELRVPKKSCSLPRDL